ncbi:MAG: hypothetical protein ACM3N4_10960 [Nitrososphaerota archaeon]
MYPDPEASGVTRRYADLLDDPAVADLAAVVAALDAYTARIASPAAPLALSASEEETPRGAVPSRTSGGTSTSSFSQLPPQATRRRGRHLVTDMAAVAAAVLVVLAAVLLFRGGFGGAGGVSPDAQFELHSISMVSASEGWAVGGQAWNTTGDDEGAGTTVLYHYKDGHWTPVYIPISDPAIVDGSHPVLQAVSMRSATDGWAAGSFVKGDVKAFFLHYDGTSWKEVDPVVPHSELPYLAPGKPRVPAFIDLSGLQMVSETDGWAAGGGHTQDGGFALLRYTGSAWVSATVDDPRCFEATPMPLTYTCRFFGLDMVSAQEGWAVGGSGEINQTQQSDGKQVVTSDTSAGVIAHFAGGRWSIEATFPHANLQRVAMVSATEGWAFGTQYAAGSDSQRPLLLHYASGTWSEAASPLDALPARDSYIGALSFSSPQDGWLVVSEYAGQDKMAGEHPALLHYTGGQWMRADLPDVPGRITYGIHDLTMVSPQEGWAVGESWLPPADGKLNPGHIGFDTPARPLILHYFQGRWSVQVS